MWPFSRRARAPDPAELLAQQARTLADAATRVSVEAAGLRERERALTEREQRLDERLEQDSRGLDELRDTLALLGRELREREEKVQGLERRALELQGAETELAERTTRLLADELASRRRADELDAREVLLTEREDELHAREARLLADELGLRRRQDELARSAVTPPPAEPVPSPAAEASAEDDRCLLFVPGSEGYRLLELEVAPPSPGERVELEGAAFSVLRVGPSPLPGDGRRCAYLAA